MIALDAVKIPDDVQAWICASAGVPFDIESEVKDGRQVVKLNLKTPASARFIDGRIHVFYRAER